LDISFVVGTSANAIHKLLAKHRTLLLACCAAGCLLAAPPALADGGWGGTGNSGGPGADNPTGPGGSGDYPSASWGGAGGGGGYGVVLGVNADTEVLNSASVNGGKGGAGGGGSGGSGGSGGIGAYFVNGGTLTNEGDIAGGNGGVHGSGTYGDGSDGNGGAGIVGGDLAITNSGSITGGLGGDGVTRANAITFTGGTNSLTIEAGSAMTGNVVAFSANDTFALGGATDQSFDVSQIGAAAQYRGFGHFAKTGSGTWTLTGTTSEVTPWTISDGTLKIGSDGNLGDSSAASPSTAERCNGARASTSLRRARSNSMPAAAHSTPMASTQRSRKSSPAPAL
jgi:hypothetical protein